MGVNRAKLYYTRDKSTKEIDKIYSRAKRREASKKLLNLRLNNSDILTS